MCPVACARDAHLDGDYSGCKAGADRHYDHSLWLTDGLEGGFGHNWGQQVGREYFMNNLDSDNIHILLHEMVRVIISVLWYTANVWSRDTPLLWMIVSFLFQVSSSMLTIYSLW